MASTAVSVLFSAMAGYALAASWGLPVPFGVDVGPALFPRILAAALLALSTANLVMSLRQGIASLLQPGRRVGGSWRTFLAFAIMLAYPIGLNGVGFLAATTVLAGLLSAVAGARRLLAVAAIALGTAVFTQLVFEAFLKMPLPAPRWLF